MAMTEIRIFVLGDAAWGVSCAFWWRLGGIGHRCFACSSMKGTLS
jgi:hypothetical protein